MQALLLFVLALLGLVQSSPLDARQAAVWESLPPTPNIPTGPQFRDEPTETADINGVRLWYKKYNELAGYPPIIMLHDSLAHSAYFGDVVQSLSRSHFVIAVDLRGHGRSTYRTTDTFTHHLIARDLYELLWNQDIGSGFMVAWGDAAGAVMAGLLDDKMRFLITGAFVFAPCLGQQDLNPTFTNNKLYNTFKTRAAKEYATIQPIGSFTGLETKIASLHRTQSPWSYGYLANIDGRGVTFAWTEHDEVVDPKVAERLHSTIVGSRLVELKGVSHFAPVQDPAQFVRAIEDAFLWDQFYEPWWVLLRYRLMDQRLKEEAWGNEGAEINS